MSVLSAFKFTEMVFTGIVIQGFFYGIYSAMFWMYIRYRVSKELGIDSDKRNILFYALCILYILSTVIVVIDVTGFAMAEVTVHRANPGSSQLLLDTYYYLLSTINNLCDLISQAILIYRCWVIWGHNIRVIIIPSVLALGFLVTWLTTIGSFRVAADGALPANSLGLELTPLGNTMYLTSHSFSLTVNAVVTFLIVFKIVKVYREVMPTSTDQTLGIHRADAKFRSIIFIIIESGMAMFAIQLIRVILLVLQNEALFLIECINQIFSGLTPTTIFIRMSMGLSYHDEQSMVQTAASWRFVPYNQDSIENAGHERLYPIGIHQSDDIEVVDR